MGKVSSFNFGIAKTIADISCGISVPKLELYRAMRELLSREIQIEDPKFYREFFPGDNCGTVKFLVDQAKKANKEIRYAIKKLDEKIRKIDDEADTNGSKKSRKS